MRTGIISRRDKAGVTLERRSYMAGKPDGQRGNAGCVQEKQNNAYRVKTERR